MLPHHGDGPGPYRRTGHTCGAGCGERVVRAAGAVAIRGSVEKREPERRVPVVTSFTAWFDRTGEGNALPPRRFCAYAAIARDISDFGGAGAYRSSHSICPRFRPDYQRFADLRRSGDRLRRAGHWCAVSAGVT